MKRFKLARKLGKARGFVIAGSMVATSMAASAYDIFGNGEEATIDVNPIFTTASMIIVAIASIWAIKKVIALGNKS